MTRMYIVYTLREGADFHTAVQALEKTRPELPEGTGQQLCRRNDPEMENSLQWMPFGDIVQILDFPEARQAQEFEASEAYAHQKARTKGMFSNAAAISCPLTD